LREQHIHIGNIDLAGVDADMGMVKNKRYRISMVMSDAAE